MWKDFKEFAFKGNVVDMAVGVIIGGAFGKIVSSLVNDVMMPLIGLIIGNVNFNNLKLVLNDDTGNALLYGAFLQNIIDFLLISVCIFAFIKVINKLRAPKQEIEEEVQNSLTTEELLIEIRDILRVKNGK